MFTAISSVNLSLFRENSPSKAELRIEDTFHSCGCEEKKTRAEWIEMYLEDSYSCAVEYRAARGDLYNMPSLPSLPIGAYRKHVRRLLTLTTADNLVDNHPIPPKSPPSVLAIARYWISMYQINFRYDNTPNSEYYIEYLIYEASDYRQVGFKIAEVHKSKIGIPQTTWAELQNARYNSVGQLISNTFNTNGNYMITGATFEKDQWPTIPKPVYVPIGVNQYKIFQCRMKFANEYYQLINRGLGFGNGAYTDITGKGFVRIHRWD